MRLIQLLYIIKQIKLPEENFYSANGLHLTCLLEPSRQWKLQEGIPRQSMVYLHSFDNRIQENLCYSFFPNSKTLNVSKEQKTILLLVGGWLCLKFKTRFLIYVVFPLSVTPVTNLPALFELVRHLLKKIMKFICPIEESKVFII